MPLWLAYSAVAACCSATNVNVASGSPYLQLKKVHTRKGAFLFLLASPLPLMASFYIA